MTKRIVITLVIFISMFSCIAQKLILQEVPDKNFEPPLFGIKGRHYLHVYYEWGVPLGESLSDSLDIRNWKSGCWNFGLRYKLKIWRNFSFLADAGYQFQSYAVKQKDNRFPDTLEHKKEKINLNRLGGTAGIRYVYSKRKKYFGKFLEAGACFAYIFKSTHYTKDIYHLPGSSYDNVVVRLRYRNPHWLNETVTEAYLAAGLELLQFRLYYRVSDLFRPSEEGKKIGELPALRFAINLALTGNK